MTPTERIVYNELKAEGYEVLNNGWPDFLAIAPDGKLRLIEVKGNGDFVKANQKRVHELLQQAGLSVEVIQFGTPGRPAVKVRQGECPFCHAIVSVRVDGTPYHHAPGTPPNYEDGKTICYDEPDYELTDYDEFWQLSQVKVFV